jgi:hypothetical protein
MAASLSPVSTLPAVPLDGSHDTLFVPYYELWQSQGPGCRGKVSVLGRLPTRAPEAFLLRGPGMYGEPAVDLWMYDSASRRFQLPTRIAEAWADAGTRIRREAWVANVDGDSAVEIVLGFWEFVTPIVDTGSGWGPEELVVDSLVLLRTLAGALVEQPLPNDSMVRARYRASGRR